MNAVSEKLANIGRINALKSIKAHSSHLYRAAAGQQLVVKGYAYADNVVVNGGERLKVGMTVTLAGPDNRLLPATVVALEGGNVTFDMNPPMAGKDLNFEITLLEAE